MSQTDFNAALLAAQKEFPPIAKTKTADMGNYRYKYADLSDIFEAVTPILHKHDLALSQSLVSDEGRVGIETRLYHTSGHVEDFGALLLPAGGTPQNAGSALTYARRYAACAALGIVADEDVDGQQTTRTDPKPTPGEWLATRVAIFKKWTADERRDTVKQVMGELGFKNPMDQSQVEEVYERAKAIYLEVHPATEDEPF